MPSSNEVHWTHATFYLSLTEEADQLFSGELTQKTGVILFDQNRGQIENAFGWISRQDPSNQMDVLTGRFVHALSAIGMMRYNVREKLIPWNEQKLAAAQRLGRKELEADSFDGLGILYAFSGYLAQAVQCFETAYDIANQTDDEELKRDIQAHIRQVKKQLTRTKTSPAKFPGALRLISSLLMLLLTKITQNPFTEITMLTNIANVYLDWGKWGPAIRYSQRALSISRKYSYRFGELDASMGLLQAKMSKDEGKGETFSMGTISDLAVDFEWSNDLSVFETLLEMAPAIKDIEAIADRLSKINDPRASEIYGQLDKIMLETDEIISAAGARSAQKNEVFVAALQGIKDNLANIVKLHSGK